jgi:DNA-binding XRE family transcriptional regulator/tetratricopeptide (TPR) repeat protein
MRNEKLIKAREERNWTQEDAAEKICVSRVTYARWEEQGIIPRPWAINEASKAFKMTPEQLGFRKYPSKTIISTGVTPVRSVQVSPDAASALDMLSVGVRALALARQQYRWTFEELLSQTEREMRRLETMTQYEGQEEGKISRRQIIALLMSAPAAALGLTQTEEIHLLQEDEAVSLSAINIPLAWRLYFAGGLAEVKELLPNYLTKLSTIAQQPSQHQQHAAGLASQIHQLGYLLALQSQDFSIAQTHAKQALRYAEIAEDPNLRIASLVRQGNLFFTMKRPLQTMQKYQEAVQQGNNASPLIVGQAYIGLAEAYARVGQKKEAETYKGLAQDTFPEHPEEDLHFAYTHFNHFTRVNFEGLMYLHLTQPGNAWKSFTQIEKELPSTLVPQRVELLSRQALTSVELGDMEQSCTYVELAATAAKKLGSELRYNEACETYQQMQLKWPHERKVKALAELFQQET